jgi:4-carboxymuconolactone decarboxylase
MRGGPGSAAPFHAGLRPGRGTIDADQDSQQEITMSLPDSISERAREGAKVRREVLGAAYVDAGKQQANQFTQHFIEFTQTQCWGNVWLREGLSHKTRSMLNVCMLAAMARWHEFEVHVRGALNNGVTSDEIAEILLHAAVYAGIPIASEGFKRADAVIRAVAAEKT